MKVGAFRIDAIRPGMNGRVQDEGRSSRTCLTEDPKFLDSRRPGLARSKAQLIAKPPRLPGLTELLPHDTRFSIGQLPCGVRYVGSSEAQGAEASM